MSANSKCDVTRRRRRPVIAGTVVLACSLAAACSAPVDAPEPEAGGVPVQGYEVVQAFPHAAGTFTQGLLFKDGYLYESTGLKGHSTVRRVDLNTGKVLDAIRLSDQLYGEGMTAFNDELILLTWKAGVGFVLNREDLSVKSNFEYEGDGWGITSSADRLYMSDGTAFIRILDPETLEEQSRFEVTEAGEPVEKLNELEWVDGEIYANIWKADKIARIDPATGHVIAWIDMTGLFEDRNPDFQGEDVLNGIAYDAESKRLFVTGKLWPQVFEITVVE